MNGQEKRALLEQYNPVLVMFPASDLRVRRPGAWWKWPTERGDYYPCPVEVFFRFVARRDRPRKWKLLHLNRGAPWLIFKSPPPDRITTVEEIQEALARSTPDQVRQWEMDISLFRSSHSSRTWETYQTIYAASDLVKQPTAYGRCVEDRTSIILQYWYFYLYNDAPNKHEGDWEMVSLELDATQTPPRPARAGYSSHDDGYRREWPQLEFASDGRPLVYVARGSHAAYFQPCEVKTQKIGWPKNLKGVVADVMVIWDKLTSKVKGGGVRDHTAKLPDDQRGGFDVGVAVPTTVLPMPETVAEAWWRALDCPWGSSHARIEGFVAPPPPWLQNPKWSDPAAWVDRLPPDPLVAANS